MHSNKVSPLRDLKTLACTSVAVLPLMWAAAPAFAQDQEKPLGIEEVVVTAQKTTQELIDVPIAITAITGDQLQKQNVTRLSDIAQMVPSFVVNYERGENSTPNFNIRGVESDDLYPHLNDSSVAIYTDGVNISDPTALNGLIFDEQRIEVLRGPQGTLFGRNTSGGLVNFISNKPTDDFSGFGSVVYGQDNTVDLEGAVGGPVTDRIRFRVSGMWKYNDGYWRNTYALAGTDGISKRDGATNIFGLRGIVDVDVDPQTLLEVTASYTHGDSQTQSVYGLGALKPGSVPVGGVFPRSEWCSPQEILAAKCISYAQILGAPPNSSVSPTDATTPQPSKNLANLVDSSSFTVLLTHDFGWSTLTSLANYAVNHYFQGFETGRSSNSPNLSYQSPPSFGRYAQQHESYQYSEELRLNGSTKAVDWVVGAFYFANSNEGHEILEFPSVGVLENTIASVTDHSWALFGQVDNHLSDEWTLSTGVRYTGDYRGLTSAQTWNGSAASPAAIVSAYQDVLGYMLASGLPTSSHTRDFTGKISLTWKPNEDNSYYALISRGNKGAGFNDGFNPFGSIAANALVAGPTGEEQVDDYEIGVKNRFFDRTLSINSAAFFYNYSNKQVVLGTYNAQAGIFQTNYANVGNAEAYGVETEIAYKPDEHWDFNFSGALLGNEITKSSIVTQDSAGVSTPLQGKHLFGSPPWTFSGIVAYHIPTENTGEFTLQSEVYGKGHVPFTNVDDPIGIAPSYVLTNFRVMWTSADGAYDAQAYVTNAFNKVSVQEWIASVPQTLGVIPVLLGEPRLWGIKLGVKF